MIREKRPRVLDADIAQVCRFNRLYERHLGEVRARTFGHELSWTEMRVFEEMGRVGDGRSAAWLNTRLALDPGYLCRILKKFSAYGFATMEVSPLDRRQREYRLTAWGVGIYRVRQSPQTTP